ncbi:hypothetical protein NEHOM01_0770 [Nematocida homosporus]|uniref:uncharacterized protein n=1 Tax=Nematocida homosporus TaxID=1912981 RepID=UPI00221EA8AF|nr:uncharacterized protein NEHOM01_0770 [Nematocida homosporus]KAI5185355.1 hypothetical protein NEHOM01_0770 [Nematocida homosporus]
MQKSRPRLSSNQTKFLCLVYKHNPRPCTTLRNQIAKDFGMSPRSVQIWFQNKRAKEKREGLTRSREACESYDNSEEELVDVPFLNSQVGSYEEYFKFLSSRK